MFLILTCFIDPCTDFFFFFFFFNLRRNRKEMFFIFPESFKSCQGFSIRLSVLSSALLGGFMSSIEMKSLASHYSLIYLQHSYLDISNNTYTGFFFGCHSTSLPSTGTQVLSPYKLFDLAVKLSRMARTK